MAQLYTRWVEPRAWAFASGPCEALFPDMRDTHDEQDASEWLHRELVGAYQVDTEAWADARVQRAMRQLHGARPGRPRLEAEVLWLLPYSAFTLPGRYLYVSRRLLERCACDAEAAFVLAHEVAHHDLGHLDELGRWGARLPRSLRGRAVLLALRLVEQRVHRQEWELDADAYALVLCARAGYAVEDCLRVFDVLKAHLLDYGQLDAVFGPDAPPPEGDDVLEALWLRARDLVHHATTSHPPLVERVEALRALVASPAWAGLARR